MSSQNLSYLTQIIWPAILDTFYMVSITTIVSTFLGLIVAIMLVLTDKDGLRPNKFVYLTIDFIINIIRSFPFIILMVAIIPITKFITGTAIGRTAALIPLIFATTPFIARLIENNLKEIDKGLIEAGKSFGASNWQIISKIVIHEAIPSIISSITFAIIAILGSSAVAGTVGAGGLGAVAISYGYQSFNDTIMYGIVIILIIVVQVIQAIGIALYQKSLK